MKNFFAIVIFCLAFCASFFSCKNTVSFRLLKDDKVAFEFDCAIDKDSPIQKMLESFGTDFNQLDLEELKFGLEEEGFSAVEVFPKKNEGGIIVKGILPDGNNIVITNGDTISFILRTETLKDFYNGSGQNIASIFDLLLVPVISDDEEISALNESEYIELIASFYGQNFADEIAKSSLKISLLNKKQNKSEKTVSFANLFTIKSPIEIKSQK